jgi:hypothetical protein
VLSQLDKLVEPLEKTLTAKLKSDAVKQEVRKCWQQSVTHSCHTQHLQPVSVTDLACTGCLPGGLRRCSD